MLCDTQIHALGLKGLIEPYNPELVQPASIDMLLGEHFKVAPNRYYDSERGLAPKLRDTADMGQYQDDLIHKFSPHGITLWPGEFMLGATEEYIRVPPELSARIEGKSSLGRMGLMVHVTAGFIDPGFEGNLTLEFYNLSGRPIILRPGKTICQVSFTRMENTPAKPYSGRYQGSRTVVGSRYGG